MYPIFETLIKRMGMQIWLDYQAVYACKVVISHLWCAWSLWKSYKSRIWETLHLIEIIISIRSLGCDHVQLVRNHLVNTNEKKLYKQINEFLLIFFC